MRQSSSFTERSVTEAAMPEAALVRELARAARLHELRRAHDDRARALGRLARWQASRMAATYADLAAQPRYADAIAFFRSDLYGEGEFVQRDADLARVVPMMARMLPESVILTVAKALQAGDVIAIKGSLGSKMKVVVDAVLAASDGETGR